MSQLRLFLIVCIVTLFSGALPCEGYTAGGDDSSEDGEDSKVPRVIYGNDNRLDYYDVTVPWQRRLIEKSVAVLVDKDVIRYSGDIVTFDNDGWKDDPCPDERFYGQPEPGLCSGILIDRQLLMTAGHCVTKSCSSGDRFVFRWYYKEEGVLQTMTKEDVYECEAVLAYSESGTKDYSIIKLDRPADPHLAPAPLRTESTRLAEGDDVVVVGYPVGLPAKAAGGASVMDPDDGAKFTANLDTYAGNSGSGVFTSDGKVVGIHVDGNEDFEDDGNCIVSIRLPDKKGDEGNVYAYKAFNALCNEGVKSGPVCGETECGDGLCSVGESCVPDCGDYVYDDDDDDSNDECPDDPNKTEPGQCGCGVPEGTCGDTDVGTDADPDDNDQEPDKDEEDTLEDIIGIACTASAPAKLPGRSLLAALLSLFI